MKKCLSEMHQFELTDPVGACAEIGQNRIRGGWGVKNCLKSSDIIYVRSQRSNR